MSIISRRGAAVGSGALVIALGTGLVLAPTAHAAPALLPGVVSGGSSSGGSTIGAAGVTVISTDGSSSGGSTVAVLGTPVIETGSGGSGSAPVVTALPAAGTGTEIVPAVVAVGGGSPTTPSTTSGTSTAMSGAVADPTGGGGSIVPVGTGALPVAGGVIETAGSVTGGAVGSGSLLDPVGSLVSTGGSGGAGSSTGSSSGGLGVTVGDGSGGALVRVELGGTSTGSGGGGGTGGGVSSTTDSLVRDITSTTSTGTGTGTGGGVSSTTDSLVRDIGSTTSTGTSAVSSGTSTASDQTGPAAAAAAPSLLSLDAVPSVATVYPVKDGYRDSVVFRLRSATASGAATPVSGLAVLRRGVKEVARWTIASSSQDLRWNGRVGGKVVGGTYRLTASAKDASGAVQSATAVVVASGKRLVATSTKLKSLAVSGTHAMAAAPRAGLSKGVVTVRVRTVASGVKGVQKLVFSKGGEKVVVRVKNGTHVSKALKVPSTFTTYSIRHTWKKGAVKLKSLQYTYSYQSLR